MKNIIKVLFLFCVIIIICVLYTYISLRERNYSEHGTFDVFQPSIGNIDVSKYMPKQTVNIKYDLKVRYSLADLCWYGFVSREDFETFIRQNSKAKRHEEYIYFAFCEKLGTPIPKSLVIYTINKDTELKKYQINYYEIRHKKNQVNCMYIHRLT